MIGELITGKNLSAFIKNLDQTLDWSALINIRDVIAHQAEGDNFYKITKFLQNDILVQDIFINGMDELFNRLCVLITVRDNTLPQFNDDSDAFWESIYNYERKCSEKPQSFSSKTNSCDAKKLKPTREERIKLRKEREANAKDKKNNQRSSLTGLDSFRKLNLMFRKKNPGHYRLSPIQIISNAIVSLENIKEFMEQDMFVQANFNFSSLDGWSKFHRKDFYHKLFARLISSPEFNDAIEYNAAQLLQYLDVISKYPEAKGNKFLDKQLGYEILRSLRNWIEHGRHLEDKERYHPRKQPSIIASRQKVVAPIMINLIFNLLPSLEYIRKCYIDERGLGHYRDSSYLWEKINTGQDNDATTNYDINQKCGAGYGF